jgi:RimJ/RimL family protein N-acetyltransferase
VKRVLTTKRGDLVIRPTTLEDAAAFRELRLNGLREIPIAFGSDYESSAARPYEHWQERVRRGAGDENGVCYVADARGALVGITALWREEDIKLRHSAFVVSVYVHPEWRGMGLATALIEACLAYAQQLGLRIVKLSVNTTNAAAIRRYLSLGFSIYGVDPEVIYYDGAYYDELLMMKRLA